MKLEFSIITQNRCQKYCFFLKNETDFLFFNLMWAVNTVLSNSSNRDSGMARLSLPHGAGHVLSSKDSGEAELFIEVAAVELHISKGAVVAQAGELLVVVVDFITAVAAVAAAHNLRNLGEVF